MKNLKQPRQSKKSKKNPLAEKAQTIPNIKEFLFSGAKFDLIIPKRSRWRRSPPLIFD